MPDCIFCALSEHQIPGHIISEDDDTLAFLDIHPLAPGHTVVIPKKHAERITDIDPASLSSVFLTVKKVSDIIHASLKSDGFTVGINDGAGGQQGVPHLHVHIIPRWTNDGGGNLHKIVSNTAPTESLESIKNQLIKK